jgi:hypothetical protein
MGLTTDLFVKDKGKKFWINMIVDAVLIFILLFMSLYASGEYQKGWEDCKQQACALCGTFRTSINQKDVSNVSAQWHP